MFNEGDTITSHEGWQLQVESIEEDKGLLTYIGTRLDTQETGVSLRECSSTASSHSISRKIVYLLDRLTYARFRARKFQSEQVKHQATGLRGIRASLIPHHYILPMKWENATIRALLADEVGLGKTIEAG